MTRASIIVLSWNGEQYLTPCLSALAGQLGRDDELIVVDNGSTDGSVSLVQAQVPAAKLIQNGRNLGFAGGANVGLRAASGANLLLVNQDVVVGNGWLEALIVALRPSGVGVAGSKLLYPDGRIQHAGGVLRYPLALPDHCGYRQPDRGQCDQEPEVDFVTGAAIGVPRRVWEEIGSFDEGFYPAFYEDVDFCSRARVAGYTIVYAPEAVATHYETTSLAREGEVYHRWMARGRLYYVLKHYTQIQFHRDFVPAEQLWGASLTAREMLEGLRMAYLDMLLDLRAVPRAGVLLEEGAAETVAETLVSLRSALSRSAGSAPGPRIGQGGAAADLLPVAWPTPERGGGDASSVVAFFADGPGSSVAGGFGDYRRGLHLPQRPKPGGRPGGEGADRGAQSRGGAYPGHGVLADPEQWHNSVQDDIRGCPVRCDRRGPGPAGQWPVSSPNEDPGGCSAREPRTARWTGVDSGLWQRREP